MLAIDFRLEPHLLSEAVGLAFVNGAGQWDIWQPLLGGLEVTCLGLKMLGSTTSENECLLGYTRISSCDRNSQSNSTIRMTNSQFEIRLDFNKTKTL